MLKKVKGVIALSRWKEVYDFTLALTFITILIAGGEINTRLIALLIANFLAMSYPFMFNDIEDAPDDAEDPKKKKRNPICNGSLLRNEGLFVVNTIFIITILLFFYISYTINSWYVFIIGTITMIVSFFYSWRKVRLKAIPIVDVITHMFMLAGSIFLTSYFAYAQTLTLDALIVLIAVMFVSGYGQMDNEIRDFIVDSKTKVKTTATVIGKRNAIILQTILIAIAAVSILYIGTRINNIGSFVQNFVISFIVIIALPFIAQLSGLKIETKVWIHRAIVLAAAVAAFLYLISGEVFII